MKDLSKIVIAVIVIMGAVIVNIPLASVLRRVGVPINS